MPYTDAQGRPELIMDPLVKRGSAGLILSEMPDGTPVDVGDLTDKTYDAKAARARIAARRQHLIDVAEGRAHQRRHPRGAGRPWETALTPPASDRVSGPRAHASPGWLG